VRVDREPLPGDPAQRDFCAEPLTEPSAGKRADDVAAAADSENDCLARLLEA
jgi:hypothetical protein